MFLSIAIKANAAASLLVAIGTVFISGVFFIRLKVSEAFWFDCVLGADDPSGEERTGVLTFWVGE